MGDVAVCGKKEHVFFLVFLSVFVLIVDSSYTVGRVSKKDNPPIRIGPLVLPKTKRYVGLEASMMND